MRRTRRFVVVLGLLVTGSVLSAGAALPPEIEDPQCLGVNKEPAHATLMPYANLREALAARRHASSFARSLNGSQKFHWVPYNPRGLWKVVSASSFERGEGETAHVLDGIPGTFWHSRWSPSVAQPPHHLVIDFTKPLNVAAVVYEARQDGNHNGRVKDYEIYLSQDGKQWGEPAAKGAFPKQANEHTIRLPQPIQARFLKFVALSEQAGQPYAAIAELDVLTE